MRIECAVLTAPAEPVVDGVTEPAAETGGRDVRAAKRESALN